MENLRSRAAHPETPGAVPTLPFSVQLEASMAVLHGIHIFAGLHESVLQSLAATCRERAVEAGTVIVEEGTMGRELYVVASGRVRVASALGQREETPLAEIGAGSFFGEMSLIECRKRAASVVAVEPCVLFALSNSDIYRLFKQWPDQFSILILNISRDLCRRLRAMNEAATAETKRRTRHPLHRRGFRSSPLRRS